MRTARHIFYALMAVALAAPACAAELTADEVVDRMVAANAAWLKPAVGSVSYARTSQSGRETETVVRFRAPRHLRAEWKGEHEMLLLPGGRGFRKDSRVAAEEWDGTRVRDWVMGGLVFRGAAWRLANHRKECLVSGLRREQVEGREAYRLDVRSPYLPDFESSGSASRDREERHELWIDVESLRPLREAESPTVTRRGDAARRATRYTQYRAFPAGGQAPMRLERWSNWPADRPGNGDPPGEASSVADYQVVGGKLWCLRSTGGQDGNPSSTREEVREVSLAPVPVGVFYEARLLRRLERVAALYEQMEGFRGRLAWDDVYRICEQILAIGEGVGAAAQNAFYLYFWHGEYEKAIESAGRPTPSPRSCSPGLTMRSASASVRSRSMPTRASRESIPRDGRRSRKGSSSPGCPSPSAWSRRSTSGCSSRDRTGA